MEIEVRGRKVRAVVFDLDETLYRCSGEAEEKMWGDLRRKLVTAPEVLAKQGIVDPEEETIKKLVESYVEQAQEIGWKLSFLAMGGSEESFFDITSSLSTADHLSYDPDLVELLNLLMQHLPVHVFTGSVRERAFEALEVLIADLSGQFQNNKLLAGDDMRQATKPDLAAYQEMLDRFDLNPETTILVDDQLSEVETAASLGMITFWIQELNQGENEFSPHILINSLADLLDHLQIDDN
ncbi:MAG: HAD family hydrolase [Candidatus Pacebacteria bacterium]|jgi:FMN phosphatase YigB (HAD superfamily)|nr:HAD family hydrolase [Candidatus Paceibacterota bacterium]